MGDTTWFGDNGYDILWVAHWTTGVDPDRAGVATGPATAGRSGSTRRTASVDGISGRVDLNRYRGTNFTPVLIP